MLKTKTKKELKQIKDMGLYDDLSALSDLLNIDYVSSYIGIYMDGYNDIYRAYKRPSKAKVVSYNYLRITGYNCDKYSTNIVIKYNGHEYLIFDTADYRYLYLY